MVGRYYHMVMTRASGNKRSRSISSPNTTPPKEKRYRVEKHKDSEMTSNSTSSINTDANQDTMSEPNSPRKVTSPISGPSHRPDTPINQEKESPFFLPNRYEALRHYNGFEEMDTKIHQRKWSDLHQSLYKDHFNHTSTHTPDWPPQWEGPGWNCPTSPQYNIPSLTSFKSIRSSPIHFNLHKNPHHLPC